MPLFENHVGVSICNDKISLVELVYSDNKFLLENVDELEFDEEIGISDFDKNSVDVLLSSLQKIISENPSKSKFISFSLNPDFFEIFEVPYESTLLQNDLNEHFRWELNKIKPHLNVDDYLVQYIELQNEILRRKDYAAILALRKNILKGLKSVSKEIGLELKFIDYSHTSANLLIKFLSKTFPSNSISILRSEKYISLIVLQNNKPAFISKVKYDEENFIDSLQQQVDKLQTRYKSLEQLKVAFLCGDEIDLGKLDDIQEKIGKEVKLINPFSVVKTSENFSAKVKISKNPARFAAAAGVALRLL